jgi:hypothetical protein
MKLGTAKSIITPAYPIRLCGYASRNKPFEMIFISGFIFRNKKVNDFYLYMEIYSGGILILYQK